MNQPRPDNEALALRNAGVVAERMRKIKGAALGVAMGKSEDWARKVLDGDSGVRLDDIPVLLKALGLKSVDAAKVCIDPDMARAYEIIVRKATREHDLIWDDAE